MKKKTDTAATEVLVEQLQKQIQQIENELTSSEDFILSYIKTLAIVHGGSFNLENLRSRYNWKLPKVQALTTAIKHFQARGLLQRGEAGIDVVVK